MKHIKTFENYNRLNENHSEKSEEIYFKFLKQYGIQDMLDIAKEAFGDISGSHKILDAKNDSDLWNALTFLDLFDNFADILKERL
jgi:hypothetical protein